MLRREQGFSLVELLVVVTLATCFYAFVYGPSSAWGQQKRRMLCTQQLQQMHAALELYAGEHDGAFPAPAGAKTSEPALSLLVPLYTTDTAIFICPAGNLRALPGALPFADGRCSYSYVAGLRHDSTAPLVADALASHTPALAGQPLFSVTGQAPGNNHRGTGGNLLFPDGHVEQTSALAKVDFTLPPGAVLLNPLP